MAAESPPRHRRVLLISYLFSPSAEMGAQACTQIARYLPRHGWMPVVLTVGERHAERLGPPADAGLESPVVRTGVIPHPLSIYRCLRSWAGRGAGEAGDGERLLRRIGAHSGLRRWILSLLTMPDISTGWILPAVVTGLRLIRRNRIEHLFSSGPPWTSHLVGLILAHLSGLPWSAHFRDPWIFPVSEMARLKPVSTLSFWLERALERMVVRRADAVVCVTDEHPQVLARAHGHTSARKFVTIPNGFDDAEWESLAGDGERDDTLDDEDAFIVTYAGTLYNRRTPAPLFRALKVLIDAGEIDRTSIRVDLLGWCDVAEGYRVSQLAAECGLDGRVRLAGPLPRKATLRRMTRSDLLLLLAEGLVSQVPGKTYEYLRAGRPILAIAPEGAVSRLLNRTGGAWVVDPADQEGLTKALRQAYAAWAAAVEVPRADPHIVARYDRRILAGRFADVFTARSPRVRMDKSRPGLLRIEDLDGTAVSGVK